MIGAVLQQEWLMGSRRTRLHVLRWLYAAWLIVLVCYGFLRYIQEEHLRQQSRSVASTTAFLVRSSAPEIVGEWFAETFVIQQMLLLVLATPTLVAGAITDEKRRGTLQYLLTADLEARHILLGKLLARVGQLALVSAAGLPLFALLAGFGGVQPITLLALGVALAVPLFALASTALLGLGVVPADPRCRARPVSALHAGRPRLLVFPRLAPLFQSPLRRGAGLGNWRSLDLAELGRRLMLASLGWGTLGSVCLGLASWRLRPAYIAELEKSSADKRRRYSATRTPVAEEPIRWRRAARRRAGAFAGTAPPSPMARRQHRRRPDTISSLLILFSRCRSGVNAGDLILALRFQPGRLAAHAPSRQWLSRAGIGGHAVGQPGRRHPLLRRDHRRARTADVGGAAVDAADAAKQLIRGKLWGIMGASYVYLLAYAAPALVLSVLGGVMSLFWVLLWLAVTVLAMYYIGAAGLWSSVRSQNSWRVSAGHPDGRLRRRFGHLPLHHADPRPSWHSSSDLFWPPSIGSWERS